MAGAVLYAKGIERLAAFYGVVARLTIRRTAKDHVALDSPLWQIVVVRIPASIAERITIDTPPVRRENTPIKLVFPVESIAEARRLAAELGGVVDPPDREWRFDGVNVCDGYDPEGNVFQLRETPR